MAEYVQGNLDQALKEKLTISGPDRWMGNAYIHNGIAYGVVLVRVAPGEDRVICPPLSKDQLLEGKDD